MHSSNLSSGYSFDQDTLCVRHCELCEVTAYPSSKCRISLGSKATVLSLCSELNRCFKQLPVHPGGAVFACAGLSCSDTSSFVFA
jgi:hypothetical protein